MRSVDCQEVASKILVTLGGRPPGSGRPGMLAITQVQGCGPGHPDLGVATCDPDDTVLFRYSY